jgi:hypothetical protein
MLTQQLRDCYMSTALTAFAAAPVKQLFARYFDAVAPLLL